MPLSAILAIAALCATASVLAVPPAEPLRVAAPPPTPNVMASTSDAASLAAHRDATATLRAVGEEFRPIFSAVEAVEATITGP